ncbi:MAG: signal peptidase II [Clostridia bacterium]|nr:signal peptidase II [Clostridia bacterium]
MWLWILIIIGSIWLDQLTKWLAVTLLQGNPSVPIIPEVFQLTYLENPGAAFGMLQNNRWVFLIVSTVGILAVFLYLLMKRPASKLLCLSLSFIVGGGIGNMIDRVLLGYVVDFFDFCLINFAIFNVADSFVCVGAGLLSLWVILDTIAEEKRLKAEKAAKEAAAKTEEKAHE